MTAEEFKRLPLRLKPSHMMQILGLGRNMVGEWIDLHPDLIIERTRRGQRVCSKARVAKHLGLPL